MTVMSAHELTKTRLCKVTGCANDIRASAPAKGPYALLCEEHYQAQRRRFSAIQSGAVDPGLGGAPAANGNGDHEAVRPPRTATADSYEEKAMGLVRLGRQVDKAFRDADKARDRCEGPLQHARDAKGQAERLAEEFRRAVREIAA